MNEEIENYFLEKSIWTEADFEVMNWHDNLIYGFSFSVPDDEFWESNFIIDIDYVFKWVKPKPPQQSFSFWVSPCTLVFKNAYDLLINIDTKGSYSQSQEIGGLYLLEKYEQEKNKWSYKWKIDLQEGFIELQSYGYKQFVRQKPIFTPSLKLTKEQRGETSFNQIACF